MPQFKLKFKNIENKMVEYQYTTENSDLIDLANGAKVLFPTKESIDESVKSNTKLVAAQRFSPENPATKAGIVKRLKIQLGLGCNYSCKYCFQNESRTTEKTKEKTKEKSDQFLANLDSWFKPEHPDGQGLRVEFWGGLNPA